MRNVYIIIAALIAAGVFGLPADVSAQQLFEHQKKDTEKQDPLEIEEVLYYQAKEPIQEENKLPIDIRLDAIKEAAASFGARSGLAKRTFEIRQELDKRARYMDKVYNFKELLVAAPSGLVIEPPIITESMNAMIIDASGQEAAVSDRIYNIIRNARIVSTARTWRSYLEREWGMEIKPPPDILVPQNDEERAVWIEYAEKGWHQGYEQADEIFQDDLNRLNMDFEGMIRYRSLLAQGMISAPYALQVDRGVTGDENTLRVGDRAVEITGVPELISGADQWKPASQ